MRRFEGPRPVHYFGDPDAERDRRVWAFLAGIVLGAISAGVVVSLWMA